MAHFPQNMPQTSFISDSDKTFLKGVLKDSFKSGYIHRPENWKGRDIRRVYVSPIMGPECCIFLGCGGGDEKGNVLLALIGFIFAFFVGLYYTGKSIQSVVLAKSDLETIQEKKNLSSLGQYPQPPPGNPPPYQMHDTTNQPPMNYPIQVENQPFSGQPQPPAQPHFYVAQPYNPPVNTPPMYPQAVSVEVESYYLYPPMPPFSGSYVPSMGYAQVPQFPQFTVITGDVNELYSKAEKLLKGRIEERRATAAAQAFMTLGAGCITVALLIVWIANHNIITIGIGSGGGGLLLVGTLLYFSKQIKFVKEKKEAQQLADDISTAIWKPAKTNYQMV